MFSAVPTNSLEVVPQLRANLSFKQAASNSDGSPAWVIHDPIMNKFYRIGWQDYEMLIRWHFTKVETIVNAVNQATTLFIEETDVEALAKFLTLHRLIQLNEDQQIAQLVEQVEASKANKLTWLVKHYLFIRIPLINPQRALKALLPYLSWLYTKQMALLVAFVTMSGLFLVTRQFDQFSATFVDQLSMAGIVSFGIALIFSKCLHELGHALTATRYGVRVGHMGLAFLVLFPMPYTDTSESWKLNNHRQRLNIASAGIIVELALAGFATLAWSLSPEGVIKSALFFLASTSWVLTLIVNLSPFLRFDGYFILSDLLDFPNLHERSAAFAKVSLRRRLFGFEDEWPETFSDRKRRALIIFASMTWVYRMILYISIAWLVYYFFFKVLGILLFIVEIWWFIVLPNLREIKVWFMRKDEIKPSRLLAGGLLCIGLLGISLIPWRTNVEGTGWIHATEQHLIYTPTAGKLASIHQGGTVKAGERLFTLTSPDIALNALRAQLLAQARHLELKGLSGIEDGESKRAQLQLQRDQFHAEVKLYQDELDRMDITAPFSGVLLDLDDNLQTNTWVNTEDPLAILINPNSWAADAFIPESEIKRIQVGDQAKLFLLESNLQIIRGKVEAIDTAKVHKLPHPMLDAAHGGAIATLPNSKGMPSEGFYKVRISFDQFNHAAIPKMLTGHVKIQTKAEAWLPKVAERIMAVLIRESGF